MLPDDVSECGYCGVPVAGFGGGSCDDCSWRDEVKRIVGADDLETMIAYLPSRGWWYDMHSREGDDGCVVTIGPKDDFDDAISEDWNTASGTFGWALVKANEKWPLPEED